MLTEKERYNVLCMFSHLCIGAMLPLRVSPMEGKLQKKLTTWWERALSWILFALNLFHSLRLNFKVVQLLTRAAVTVPLHHRMIHLALAAASLLFMVYQYVLYIQELDVYGFLVKLTLGRSENAEGFSVRRNAKRGAWQLTEYSLQDLVAILVPYAGFAIVASMLVAYAYEPRLLTTTDVSKYGFWGYLALLMAEEARFYVCLIAVVAPAFQVQVIGLEMFNSGLQAMEHSVSKRRYTPLKEVREDYVALRRMQLHVVIWNSLFRHLVFVWKLLALFLSITCGYAAIAHFGEYPVFGVMYYLIFVSAALSYSVMYAKGFQIPRRFEQVRRLLSMKLGTDYWSTRERRVLKKQLRSIPPMGIKVGDFHTLERSSTPRFVSYVLENIVSMLVTF